MGKENNHLQNIISCDCYKNELKRIDKDNSVEQGLYFMIQLLIRVTIGENYWVTDVSTRSKKDIGLTESVPDLAILGDKSRLDNPIALVEIKYFPWSKQERLSTNIKQVESYLQKVDKVIYTNGIEWIFLYGKNGICERTERICLGNDMNPPRSYYEPIDKKELRSKIHWKNELEYVEAWDDLIRKLSAFLD